MRIIRSNLFFKVPSRLSELRTCQGWKMSNTSASSRPIPESFLVSPNFQRWTYFTHLGILNIRKGTRIQNDSCERAHDHRFCVPNIWHLLRWRFRRCEEPQSWLLFHSHRRSFGVFLNSLRASGQNVDEDVKVLKSRAIRMSENRRDWWGQRTCWQSNQRATSPRGIKWASSIPPFSELF